MQNTAATGAGMWQRRTHKIVAAAAMIIGLTMMLSAIPQCVYPGLAFIVTSLAWLGWMTMKEKNRVPSSPSASLTSPVLFLVTSQSFSQPCRFPTPVDPNDKPPSYDTILKLDGCPPDYCSVLMEKPPKYNLFVSLCINIRCQIFRRYDDISSKEGNNKDPIPRVHSISSLKKEDVPLVLEVPSLPTETTTLTDRLAHAQNFALSNGSGPVSAESPEEATSSRGCTRPDGDANRTF